MATRLQLPETALVEFRYGVSNAAHSQGKHYVSLFVNSHRVAKVEGYAKEALMVQALASWIEVQFAEELPALAARAYATFPQKIRRKPGDLQALIVFGPRKVSVNHAVGFADLTRLLEVLGYTLSHEKSAAKEKVEYYIIRRYIHELDKSQSKDRKG